MPSHIETRDTPAGRRYKAVVTIGSGRGAQRITRTERTREAAERAIDRLEKVASGGAPKHDLTVGEVMGRWLSHLERTGQVAPATLTRYRQVCATLGEARIWKRRLATLRPDEIESAISAGPGGIETKRLRWRVLRAGLRWGARCYRTTDPTPNVRPPRSERTKRTTLDGAGLAALIESTAGNPILDPFVLLAAVTGKRRNEVLGLRVEDLDLDTLRLSITKSLEWIDGRPWRLKDTKTGADGHAMVPDFALERLQHLVRDRFHRPDAFLCSLDGGRSPLCPRDVSLAFRRHADALGLDDLRVHDLRHSFATVLAESGVPLKTIQEALSHADARTTMRYQHPHESERVVAATIGQAIHGPSHGPNVEGASVSEATP